MPYLNIALQKRSPYQALELLVAANPDATKIIDDAGDTPLHVACRYEAKVEIVRALYSTALAKIQSFFAIAMVK